MIENPQILVALIAAIPPTLIALAGFIAVLKGQKQIYLSMNSRLDELLKLTAKSAHAEGMEAQRKQDQKPDDYYK